VREKKKKKKTEEKKGRRSLGLSLWRFFLCSRLGDWCGGNVLIMEKKGGKREREKWQVGLSCIK